MLDKQNISGPVQQTQDRVHSDNYVLNEIKRSLFDSSDAFGNINVRNVRNELDIASHYSFSPERLRLFRNGSREFPQYNTVTQFNDAPDVWQLQPDAGDTMHIESAESGSYVVGYALQGSFAFQTNQSLQSGDVIQVGPRNETDGWYMEQRGADHTDSQVDIIELSGGGTTTLVEDAELDKPITEWNRYAVEYNWYGAGNQEWSQSYTDDGRQINDEFTLSSRDGVIGPETGNLNLWYEVTADADTSGLELHVGSMSFVVLGDPVSLARSKQQFEQITITGSTNTWEPFYALRIDPDDGNVNAQFSQLEVLDYGAAADIEVIIVSVDPSKTDASGWGEPSYHHASNSALQVTESVSQVPNASGTQTDLGSNEKPGGYTIATSIDVDGGNTSGESATRSGGRLEKKRVLSSDVLVFLARTSNVDNELSFVWDVDQRW